MILLKSIATRRLQPAHSTGSLFIHAARELLFLNRIEQKKVYFLAASPSVLATMLATI
jgi:hypothetical protein